MLKKLLASALAVATVASCAYVPTALASAATTYETADAVDYAVWQLENPEAAPESTVDVTVYVVGNVDNGTTKKYQPKVSENSVDYIKAELAKVYADDADGAYKYEITVSATASQNVYVAHVSKAVAVYYYPVSEKIADSKVKLGYYVDPTSAILVDMYTNVATPKMANYVFNNWEFDTVTNTIVPVYKSVGTELDKYYYTEVTVVRSKAAGAPVAWLTSGAYYTNGLASGGIKVLVPNTDKANWMTYIENYVVAENEDGVYTMTAPGTDADPVVNYEYSALRQVATNVYAVVYKAPEADETTADTIKYTYKLWVENDAGTGIPKLLRSDTANIATTTWTTDIAEVYAMVAAKNKYNSEIDTLAEFLVFDDNTHYTVKEYTIQYVNTYKPSTGGVQVDVVLTPADKYTVYSYAEGDKVVKSTAYLTAAQVATTEYKNIDATTQLVNTKSVLTATAVDLGVATEATVKGVPAVYAYAQKNGVGEIECTYKMGDATASMADFETTTGEFNSEAYFCRDAKAGDEVCLKVSLSATGVAKGLDYTKISVSYNVVGATAGENYVYSGSELYKDGIASDITLAAGTNIVTATVSYNGVVIGTFAPFYAYVG